MAPSKPHGIVRLSKPYYYVLTVRHFLNLLGVRSTRCFLFNLVLLLQFQSLDLVPLTLDSRQLLKLFLNEEASAHQIPKNVELSFILSDFRIP